MVKLLDLEAMKAAHEHVWDETMTEPKLLAGLATELASILRTCGFYFFILQLCGAHKGEEKSANMAKALRTPLMKALRCSGLLPDATPANAQITPDWALRQCEAASLPQLLLLKEFTATFLAYVHFEARAKQSEATP